MVNAKTAFTVHGWLTFGSEVGQFLTEKRGQLEDLVLTFFIHYFTAHSYEPAENEIKLCIRLGPGLFCLVSEIAAHLNLGMKITDSSSKFLALALMTNRLTLSESIRVTQASPGKLMACFDYAQKIRNSRLPSSMAC